ncbi:S-adenosyl-L-methionine-dependent methyltransferase [Penicillium chrysogenum]|jgi:SAM-dependent methyltransferase|uniref:S-adenosyl-L-methionine-dependent methyltransferase n=1 Tax=Penicillium chrysogenum TaxID=5076 RepID=A0ABQ8WQB8_PENCH|nr:S-adenosyl-L-methionine-dependent methyltransferase [Penicillium chrysogenum]KAJ5245022.1 S-adenosyl-L-methionine-dependent methyltransferase [Penicillium chrysogenum]KAJ5274877.1 S-adenosyl-L-methionine-dependent methyltransferase [Penicillium chrysogenum]
MATPTTSSFDSNDKLFEKGQAFWNNYLKGRPSAPDIFFQRLFNYHQSHSGHFGTVHDVGAGNGPYAQILRSKFQHVIISDIAEENVVLAEDRLGHDGFSYRAARVEEGDDIPQGSIDMVFATNVMHFCDQSLAMNMIAKQLRPGGTFACAAFGAAQFDDPQIQDIYTRINHSGGRALLKKADDPDKLLAVMARTQGKYNVAPLDESLFLPGAQRIHLNMQKGGITAPLPPNVKVNEPVYTGVDDVEVFLQEEGWSFVANLESVKEHVLSFPFAREDPHFGELWQEMEEIIGDSTVRARWPAKIILATRR